MARIIHKGIEYLDMVIIDGSIVLQSLHQDVIFENGYKNVCARLSDEYWAGGFNCTERDYILEYEVEAMKDYIKEHDGIVQINNVN